MVERKRQVKKDSEYKLLKKDIERLDEKVDRVEKRLEVKIETETQSMKDYIDSRISPVNLKMDNMQQSMDSMQQSMGSMQQSMGSMQQSINHLGEKLDTSVKGIVQLIERSMGTQSQLEERVDDHDRRIEVLEAKA